MRINFTGQNLVVTPALRAVVRKKAQHIFNHFDKNIIKVDVVLKVEKLRNIIEMRVYTGKELYASAEDETMYKAIDQMIAKMERQIGKIKEKNSNHRE